MFRRSIVMRGICLLHCGRSRRRASLCKKAVHTTNEPVATAATASRRGIQATSALAATNAVAVQTAPAHAPTDHAPTRRNDLSERLPTGDSSVLAAFRLQTEPERDAPATNPASAKNHATRSIFTSLSPRPRHKFVPILWGITKGDPFGTACRFGSAPQPHISHGTPYTYARSLFLRRGALCVDRAYGSPPRQQDEGTGGVE